MTIDQMIEVLDGCKKGKKIQYYENGRWIDTHFTAKCHPDFVDTYRVKPKAREWNVWVDDNGLLTWFYNGDPIKVREVLE